MITGAHAIAFSPDAGADRAFIRDVLGLDSVDAGGGWPIYALPPAELAVHPGEPGFGLYLMCDDIHATIAELRAKGARIAGTVEEQRWGLVTSIELPSGARLGLYEPRHLSPRS
jgi:catechol 2,3-dioxygenase-like lactoylglutathione lyase family enzyme